MSGTLGDVFMFRSNRGFPGGVLEEAPRGMSLEGKDGGLSNKQRKDIDSTSTRSTASIECQNLIKDGVITGNRSMFGDSDGGSFPVLNQQKFRFMGSIGVGSGSPWDCPRADSTAVNFLQTFGPISSGSSSGVDGQLREVRIAADEQQQMLTEALRRPSSSCEAAADVAGGVKEEEEFGCGADSSSTISGHVLQGGTISNSGQRQQLFATARGLMPSPASMQQLNRSPNHAIRNLFPEKSSSSLSSILQSHEDLGGKKVVDEQGLLQVPKKPRMQEYGCGGPVSSPLPLSEVEKANRLSQSSTSDQYRKSPFADEQRSALANLMDCSSPYSKCAPTSFSSYPPADRSSSFNSSSLSSLHNPSISLSSFQTSGCSLLPMKNSSNESSPTKSPKVDYGRYTLGTSHRMQGGGDYRGELLGTGRDTFLGVSSPQIGLNFMPLATSLGSQPFNFSCRRQSSLDTGAAWPAGLLSNVPSLSMETPSRTLLPSKRTLHDREQPDVLFEDREARRVHSLPDSKRRMLIQKQLTTTDVGSLGRIILPKKEAETHLPHLPDKEGIEMYMYDYEADRTWTMKYRFWPNNKSRMYLLENTGEFAKFHALQQGDWLFIFRESVNRYVLRAKKSAPLLQVTPSSQSGREPSPLATAGGPPAAAPEELGGATSLSGRMGNQSPSPPSTVDGGSGSSSSKEMVCGTAAASCNPLSLDVPSPRFSSSPVGPTGPKSSSPIIVEAKKPFLIPHDHQQQQHDRLSSGTLNRNSSNDKHLVHQLQPLVQRPTASRGAAAAREDGQHRQEQHQDQELRLKNYMAVHQQQPAHEMPSELDGGGDLNLEDFPRLIDADDETIENFLGNSESHVSVDGRSRGTVPLRGRGEEDASSSRRSI